MFFYSRHSLLYSNLGEKTLHELSEIFHLVLLSTSWMYAKKMQKIINAKKEATVS